jgi:organic hydroperoxide reductase OsmC/OhrA
MEINVTNTGMDYHASSSSGMELSIVFGPEKPAEDKTMNPVELFISGLSMCIAAMLRKFCTEHGLDAGEIKVDAQTDWEPGKPMCSYLDLKVFVEGRLGRKAQGGVRQSRGDLPGAHDDVRVRSGPHRDHLRSRLLESPRAAIVERWRPA